VIIKQTGGENEDTKYVFNSGEAKKSCVLSSSENELSPEGVGVGFENGVVKVLSGGVAVASELMA
jgi:hypothetical protein